LRRTTPPPPAGSAVYELTERGSDLEPALLGLARWGLGLLDEPRPDDAFRPLWAVQAAKATFRLEAARWARETYEFHVGVDVFHRPVEDGVSEPETNPPSSPTSSLGSICTPSSRSSLAGTDGAIEIDRLDVENDPDALARVGEIFSLPPA
jgi:hypothetical protein